MFVYTVYPAQGVIRKGASRRVDPVRPVEPVRSTQPSWRMQYGNAGQPQHPYVAQKAGQAYLQHLQHTPHAAEFSLPSISEIEQEEEREPRGEIVIQNTQPLLAYREPQAVEPDYIQRRARELDPLLEWM